MKLNQFTKGAKESFNFGRTVYNKTLKAVQEGNKDTRSLWWALFGIMLTLSFLTGSTGLLLMAAMMIPAVHERVFAFVTAGLHFLGDLAPKAFSFGASLANSFFKGLDEFLFGPVVKRNYFQAQTAAVPQAKAAAAAPAPAAPAPKVPNDERSVFAEAAAVARAKQQKKAPDAGSDFGNVEVSSDEASSGLNL